MEEKRRVKPYEIGELDQYLLGQGNHYEIYKKLGAHLVEDGDKKGTYFAVWAPNAQKVSVIGEFNDWDLTADVMERNESGRNLYLFCGRRKRERDVQVLH